MFFVPGALCALIPEDLKIWRSVRVILFLAGVAAFGYSLWIETAPYGATRLALCAIGFPCLLFGYRGLLSIRPLRMLGEVSYSIYMIHLLVASVFSFVVSKNPEIFQALEDKVIFGLVMLVGMYVLSFVSYALIERPFMSKSLRQPVERKPVCDVHGLTDALAVQRVDRN
ncbi:Acyltransferase family protein [compost metagenome]